MYTIRDQSFTEYNFFIQTSLRSIIHKTAPCMHVETCIQITITSSDLCIRYIFGKSFSHVFITKDSEVGLALQ